MTGDLHHLQLARRLVATGLARSVREMAGASRAEFASEVACSVAALRAWESGARRPSGRLGVRYGRVLTEVLTVGGDLRGDG